MEQTSPSETVLLGISGGLPDRLYVELSAILSPHVTVRQAPFLIVRAGPLGRLPATVKLLANWQVWAVGLGALGVMAEGFLGQIGVRAADAVWDEIENAFKAESTKPLAELSRALSKAANHGDEPAKIIIGLDYPDHIFGTVLVISDTRPEAIAHAIAKFSSYAEDVARVVHSAVAAGQPPIGPVNVEFNDDGTVDVIWMPKDLGFHTERLAPR